MSHEDAITFACFVAYMKLADEGTWANPDGYFPGEYSQEGSEAGDVHEAFELAAKSGAEGWLNHYTDDAPDYLVARVRKEFRL